MESAIAGGGLLAMLLFFVAFVLFWVALPGMITGWLLKRSGRSYGWGFVLGLLFGPLGILIGLIFAIIGRPQSSEPIRELRSDDLPDSYTEAGGGAMSAFVFGVSFIIFCVICGGAFMVYERLPESPTPHLVASYQLVAPVPARPSATPTAPAQVTPTVIASPEASPELPAEEGDVGVDVAAADELGAESLEAANPAADPPGTQQKLPVNFVFKRETGQDTGVPLFILSPREEAMNYDARRGSTFEALGLMAQPERDKFGIAFFNAKKEFQLRRDKEKGVLLRIDGEEFKIAEYTIVASQEIELLKVESAAIVIDRNIFEKLIKADDVFIRVGSVMYSLDEDNIEALRYYGAEVAKDISRRSKRKQSP